LIESFTIRGLRLSGISESTASPTGFAYNPAADVLRQVEEQQVQLQQANLRTLGAHQQMEQLQYAVRVELAALGERCLAAEDMVRFAGYQASVN